MHQKPKYSMEYYISLFKQGDERGFNFIFHKLYRLMVCYANERVNSWQTAEEIASGAFAKAWPQHHKLGQLAGIKTYLFKIIERDSVRALQKQNRYRHTDCLPAVAMPEDHNILQSLVKAETYNMLYEAIQKLSPGMRAVMESMYIEGHSLTETAHILNLSTSTVDTQKKRALKVIQKLIPRLSILIFIYPGISFFNFLAFL